MSALSLTLACGEYDRTRALLDGRAGVTGVDLHVLPLNDAFDRHDRMLRHEEFDACELSMSSFLMARSRGRRLIAIPVFPYRMFRHQFVLCRQSRVKEPADLRGKRVGIGMYQVTTALWVRGMLKDEYGVHPEEMIWVTDRPELEATAPPGVRIERCPPDRTLEEMLVRGELDALILIESVPEGLLHEPDIGRLFPDYPAVERAYYEKTGIYPIMHAVVLKEALYEAYPWLAVELMRAFERARDLGDELNRYPRTVSLAWAADYFARERALFGPRLYPYGIRANRPTLDALIRYSHEQGLTAQPLPLESLFAATTLDT